MNKNIKKQWLKALRSGKYRQTRGKLKSQDGSMCCLGVLCDIQKVEWERSGVHYFIYGRNDVPPKSLLAGIADYGPLTQMNDGLAGMRQHSFSEIADYIEEHL